MVKDSITVDIKDKCQTLTVGDYGNMVVNTRLGLTIYEVKALFISGEEVRRTRQR